MISLPGNLSRLILLLCLFFSINFHEAAALEKKRTTFTAIPVSGTLSSRPFILNSPVHRVLSEQLSCSSRIKLERKRRKTLEVTSALFDPQSCLFNPFISNSDPFPIKQGSPRSIQSEYQIRGPPSIS
jgi:hypothetical protein